MKDIDFLLEVCHCAWLYYEFRLRVALGLGGDLMLTSRIRNTNADGKPFSKRMRDLLGDPGLDCPDHKNDGWNGMGSVPSNETYCTASKMVWNPWDRKAKAMPDFGDDEYKHMLCVEAAAIEKPITLKPGEEWKGRLELSAVPSSYCSGQLDPRKVLQG
ncbi:hypothetical protein GW17_00003275 [Ensete ventricosum]|nr:hypothetical protein GW17_00003275 [Ensete ventricosum]